MGFDNECILNIQSLAGEYFCPVCRTLVYPHEAVQTQCTHLYCKPCLSYVVSSTQACPYDGYLVTEAGSKPLMECNKALAETIGKTTVHCLYHRSGCVWQGPLSDCTTHCSGCAFGNSPVVCNRCGIHIVHRQVQEHAQTCNANGTNTQSQPGGETTQVAASSGVTVPTDHSKIANQAAAPASQPQASHTATGLSAAQNVNQAATVNPPPQAMPANAVPTPDQQYYQQYQQYYQQYPGYDPYQQGYQQYYLYQQPPAQQFQPQPQLQQQVQAPGQLQPQVQPQPQPQPQTQTQAQSQISANGQPQPLYSQPAVVGSSQNQAQVNPPHANPGGPPLPQGHMPPPSYSQAQPYPAQNHAQPHMQAPQFQQPHPQINHSQPSQVQPPPYPQAQPQFQPHLQPQPQLQPLNPQHPPVQSVGGHLPYSQQAPQQQHPMQMQSSGSLLPGQMQAQFPPPPPHMRPPQPPHMLPPQQRPIMQQVQQPMPPQYMQQPQAFTGQAPGQLQGQPHHAGSFAQQTSQVNPPGPPQPMQQPPLGYVQPQQVTALPPHSSQSYIGRPGMLNQGGQSLQFPQSSVVAGIPPHARPPHNVSMTNQPPVYSEQQHNQYAPPERRAEQDRSPSLKKHEPVANDSGANIKDVKSEAVINDERKSGNGGDIDQRKDESRDGDSMLLQRVKEESKERTIDHSPGGKSSQNKTEDGGVSTTDSEVKNGNAQQGQIGDVSGGFPSKGTEHGRSPHPHMPHGHSGQQQRPAAPASHLRPLGPGYFPHPGEHFHPPGPSQHGPFPSEGPFSGPPGPGSTIYGNDSRSYDVRPPLGNAPHPHGPDPRLLGPMESDMYQNQRPPHYDSRRPDSYLSGNVDRGPYGKPFGVESNSTRMNGGPPLSHDSSLAPGFRDDNFKNPAGMHPDTFPMGPTRYHDQGEFKGTLKQFPGPPHLGSEGSPKFGNHSSRPIGGYGMDGPSRFLDKDPHGYDYHSAGGLHPGDSGGRPLPASIHDDNRGRFDNNRHNPDFLGPMHGFGRHNRDRLPPGSPGYPSRPFRGPHNVDFDGREMERHPFGNRFPMGPPGRMHRGEFDGLPQPRSGEPFGPRGRGEPGIGFFQEYGRPGESNGSGGFSHQPPFGELYGTKSTGPHLGEPGFRSSYSRQGFPSDGGFFAGGPDSFDPLRKRKTSSMGWCRICKVDCESVEGLDMHGQTREHQRMSMDMVISIKQKNAKKQKAFNDHSPREEASKFRKPESNARANMS